MKNYINKKFSLENTPETSNKWKKMVEKERIILINSILQSTSNYESFEVLKAQENGHVILKTEKAIQASERGVLLLEMEENLKKEIDIGITIWLDPVGDKSKLRNLRGIKIKKEI